MDSQLYVQIENKSLIPFFDLAKDVSRSLTLTTIKDYQRKAIVTIYSRNPDGSNRKLRQFSLDPIPPAPAGEPKIGLRTRKSGARTAELTLSLNRKFIAGGSVKLPGVFPWKPVLLILLLILLLTGAGWGIMRLAASAGTPAAATGQVSKEPATPTPKAAPAASPAPAPAPEITPAPTAISSPESGGAKAVQVAPEPVPPPEPRPLVPPSAVKKTIYFTPDSAVLTADARRILSTLIPELKKYPDTGIEISGHCAPHGTEQGRQELSLMRAEAVASYLKQNGLTVDKVSGLGARFPATNDLEQQNLNRRVEILQQDKQRE